MKLRKCIFTISAIIVMLVFPLAIKGETNINDVIQPSPTVAAMCKYGQTPVNHATGVPQISIPIYTIECGELKLPITLDYHAGGIRVDEAASWVGLGWSLSAGGSIGVSINGMQDETGHAIYPMPSFDMLENNDSVTLFGHSGYEYDKVKWLYSKQTDGAGGDRRPDIFTYNVLGSSGQFVFAADSIKTGQRYLCRPCDLSGNKTFEFSIVNNNVNEYDFQAKDVKGNSYVFLDREITRHINDGSLNQISPYPITAWQLSSIVSHNNKDYIHLKYSENTECEYKYVPDNLYYARGIPGSFNTYYNQWRYETTCLGNSDFPNASIGTAHPGGEYRIKSVYYTQKLDTIVASNGMYVVFVRDNDREDLYKSQYKISNPGKLASIKIFNKDGECLKRWEFEYSYFVSDITSPYDSTSSKRLKLCSISEYGNDGVLGNKHTFEYYGEEEGAVQMPFRHSYAGKDAWGYFNGATTQQDARNSRKAFCNFSNVYFQKYYSYKKYGMSESVACTNETTSYCDGAPKEVNPDLISTYSLKKITYPTGGYTEFEYEPNVYSTEDLYPLSVFEHGDSLGAGQRVKKITDFDGIKSSVRSFKYSTGDLMERPRFMQQNLYQTYYIVNSLYQTLFSGDVNSYLTLSPVAVNNLGIFNADNIVYPYVTVIYDDGTKHEYSYSILEKQASGIPEDNIPFYGSHFYVYSPTWGLNYWIYNQESPPYYQEFLYKLHNVGDYPARKSTEESYQNSYDYRIGTFFARGLLLGERIVNQDGQILYKERNNYTIKNINKIPGLNIIKGLMPDVNEFLNEHVSYTPEFYYLNFYYILAGTPQLTGTTKTEYRKTASHSDDSDPYQAYTTYTYYSYNEHNLQKSSTTTFPTGDIVKKTTIYPSDISVSDYADMTACRMLDYPIEEIESHNGKTVSAKLTTFSKQGDSYYPNAIYSYTPEQGTASFAVFNGTVNEHYGLPDYTLAYNNGRITSITDKAGLLTQYVWDANSQYPLSETKNAETVQHTRTFTYSQGLGMTSETSPAGYTLEYHYDGLGRLEKVSEKVGATTNTLNSYLYYTPNATVSETLGNFGYITKKTYLGGNISNALTERQYYDGLGYPTLKGTAGANTTGEVVYSLTEYDACRRTSKEWMPAVGSSSIGYISNSSYASLAAGTYGDINQEEYPYTSFRYDALGRKTKVFTAGREWAQTHGHVMRYLASETEEVKQYQASATGLSGGNEFYPAGSLLAEDEKDENGQLLRIYKDAFGRKVLERRLRFYSERRSLTAFYNDTYFVYNDAGLLRYVLQPMFQHEPDVDLYAYQYSYDNQGRIIKKIIPGCEHIEYSYDHADRMIAMQDGLLRSKGLTRHFVYDNIGRMTAQILRDSLALHDSEIRNYYDDGAYEFLNYYSCSSLLAPSISVSNNVTGLQTGRVTRTSNGTDIVEAIYYNAKGQVAERCIRQIDSRITRIKYQYDLAGKITQQTTEECANGEMVFSNTLANSFAHATELLVAADATLNVQGRNLTKRIAEFSYDRLGRTSIAASGPAAQTNQYNIHGWKTRLSSDNFTEQLNYTLNGNISRLSWKNGADGALKSYSFMYDNLGFLLRSMYSDERSGEDDYSEHFYYDENGNIESVERWGYADDEDTPFADVDYLNLYYNGNQLRKVYDEGYDWPLTPDFKDGANLNVEYTYNQNGSLTSDANKGIAHIEYDNLNYPKRIQFTDGSTTEYVYSSEGRKLRVKHTTAVPNITIPLGTSRSLSESEILSVNTIDYWDDVVCENGEMKKYLFDGGYADITGDSLRFHYYIKDHLGSIRIVQNEQGKVEQINNYYPYGNTFGEYNSSDIASNLQPYKFNGKEHDAVHGLDLLDYGARMYDNKTGRWTAVDPLAEDYYHVSPYAYCLNNPVKFVDPDGKSIWTKLLKASYKVAKIVNKKGWSSLKQAETYTSAFSDIKENIDILIEEDATNYEKLWAGTSLLSEILPISIGDIKDVKNLSSKKNKSINQLNQDVKKGKAPKEIERFDNPHSEFGKKHVHFKNKSALNENGSWKDGESFKLNKKTKDYLEENGWLFNKEE